MNSKYSVNIKRDMRMMKTCIKFNNRIYHPRVSLHLFVIGAALLGMPAVVDKGEGLGNIICILGGAFFIFMALFRHNIAAIKMKRNSEAGLDEELSYQFGEKGIQVVKDGNISNLGGYKNIFRIWEDERHFYLGMYEDDLLILPKKNFETRNEDSFRNFILEKSKAEYSWKPADILNICRQKIKRR